MQWFSKTESHINYNLLRWSCIVMCYKWNSYQHMMWLVIKSRGNQVAELVVHRHILCVSSQRKKEHAQTQSALKHLIISLDCLLADVSNSKLSNKDILR